MSEDPSAALLALARAHGIRTSHWSFFGEHVTASAPTLRALLAALGVHADTPEQLESALYEAETGPWRRLLPPSLVTRVGVRSATAYVADGHDVELSITLENGEHAVLPIPPQQPESREIDGRRVWRVEAPLPEWLPVGWHTLHAVECLRHGLEHGGVEHNYLGHDDLGHGQVTRRSSAVLAIAPHQLPPPQARPGRGGRSWGLTSQLYSLRSRASWGMGDLADLADLAAIASGRGADFLLLNPLHAGDVASPIEPSPYLPTSRRFLSPLYARPEQILEFAYLDAAARERVLAARTTLGTADLATAEGASGTRLGTSEGVRIDRDAAWAAKRRALEAIFDAGRGAARQAELDAFLAQQGRPLQEFAAWCARQGGGGITEPERRREFFAWLQWVLDEQAGQAQSAALAAGMRIGLMHDLAVGVDATGFDASALREAYAQGVTVGAPPDMYNAAGQNWNQPPWHPAGLAEAGYAPLRDLLRQLLRHAGALRVDHIIGLFRLWCIPAGFEAAQGAYLAYDHEAMLGVLTIEAVRAGAVVIGEDLGTVEPWVREELASRGILGTSVLWFEREGEGLLPAEHYRRETLATVTTHDLPPTESYLSGEHLALAERLGLLNEGASLDGAVREHARTLEALREFGLLEAGATGQELVEALHRFIAHTPSLLVGVSLTDAVGERRSQNVPGTHREYPNWQLPLAVSDGSLLLLEDLASNPRFLALTAVVERALGADDRGLTPSTART